MIDPQTQREGDYQSFFVIISIILFQSTGDPHFLFGFNGPSFSVIPPSSRALLPENKLEQNLVLKVAQPALPANGKHHWARIIRSLGETYPKIESHHCHKNQ